MNVEEKSLYECQGASGGKWLECSVEGCARRRRINQSVDMVIRLEHYKMKLDAGLELEDIEQADLEAIGKHIADVLQSFMEALQETFKPIIENLIKVLNDIWDSFPEEMRFDLMKAAAPRLEFKLGDVATPKGAMTAQSRVFGLSANDMPTIQQNRNLS